MFFHLSETCKIETRNIAWRRERRGCFSLESPISLYRSHSHSFKAKQSSVQVCLVFPFCFVPLIKESIKRLLYCASNFTMATKIKGIYKGFKYISQIFVVKEREMEIGYPTDVKHVAHIGLDGPSGSAPSWMNEFKAPPDFSTTTLGNPRDSNSVTFSPWSSQDFDQSTGHQSQPNLFNNIPPSDLPNVPKKPKRKKKATTCSPKSSSSSSRSSRKAKSKAMYLELETAPGLQMPTPNLQV